MRVLPVVILLAMLAFPAIGQQDSGAQRSLARVQGFLKFPYVNYLAVRRSDELHDDALGFIGLGGGIRYKHGRHHFLEASGSLHLTSLFPIPVHVDETYSKSISSISVVLSDNLRLGRYTIGYGISYAFNTLVERTREDWLPPGAPRRDTSFVNHSLGVTLSGHYQFSKRWSAGVLYRPSILRLQPSAGFWPEHLVSFELSWQPGRPAPRASRQHVTGVKIRKL